MKIVTWNMNKRKKDCWEWLLDSHDPEFVMAQEASPLPDNITATVRTTTKKNKPNSFLFKKTKSRSSQNGVRSRHGIAGNAELKSIFYYRTCELRFQTS